jgi:TonB-linked SusC/RagA family outer membrane protein
MKRLCVFLALVAFVGINFLHAQTVQITGTVTSAEDGMPIPGVSIIVKGTTIGAATDIDGKYTLSVPQTASILVYTFVGMRSQEVEIAGRTIINVILELDTQELEEVMVVAYGTTTKSSYTGSASVVKAETIEKIQTSNVSKALEGLTPGVQVTSSSGQPGTEATIRIRGIGSINASNRPLYVVDGQPYEGPINAINPSDIESMTVLKDATSAALYGARGANGVIIITTKKGKKGDARINFDSKVGVNVRGIPEYDIITEPSQYYELYWSALRNSAFHREDAPLSWEDAGVYASNELINVLAYNIYDVANTELVDPVTGKLNPNANILFQDDWYNELFSSGIRTETSLSVSGGDDKYSYYLSLGHLSDEGYAINSIFDRYSARLNADSNPYEWLKIGLNLNYSYTDQNFPSSDASTPGNSFFWVRNIAPIYPVYLYDNDGNLVLDAKGDKQYDWGVIQPWRNARPYVGNANPAATLRADIRDRFYDSFNGKTFIDIKFLNDFTFTANLSASSINYDVYNLQTPIGGDALNVGGRGSKSSGRTFVLNSNQLLRWVKQVGDHNFNVLIGHETYDYHFSYLYGQKENFLLPNIPELDNAARLLTASSYATDHRIEGYLSNANYNYLNKYFFSASFRRDGSSRFHPDSRWGNFYSVGATWRIIQEDFMQGLNFIDDLKFKVSYGEQGNEGLLYDNGYQNYLPYLTQYTVSSTAEGDIGITYDYPGNKDITWEKSRNFNTGIEFGLFDLVTGQIEYFQRKAADLLFNIPLPPSSGLPFKPINAGDMVNRGVELELTFNPIKSKDFNWSFTIHGTHYKNELVKLPDELAENGVWLGTRRRYVGYGIYDWWMIQYAGVYYNSDDIEDRLNGSPQWYYQTFGVDTEGNDIEDPDHEEADLSAAEWKITTDYNQANKNHNKKNVGSSIPDLMGGFSTTLEYKGIDFSIVTNFQIGGLVFDNIYFNNLEGGTGTIGQNWHADILDAWSRDNVNSNLPRVEHQNRNLHQTSDLYLIDASFFNIRNISVGYTLPKNWYNNIPIGRARIYGVIDNVALFSKMKGLDPRQYVGGTTGPNYSPIRTYSVGINLNF